MGKQEGVVPAELECVVDGGRAAVLLQHPLRSRILSLARRPVSATELASELSEPRQKVNYHVRRLEGAGFMRRAGRRRKRNMVEQRYVATARSYVIAPQAVGPLAAGIAAEGDLDPGSESGAQSVAAAVADGLSAAHLVALAARAQAELAEVVTAASAEGKRVATLSLGVELRFEGAEQRRRFAEALQEAVVDVVGRYSSPARLADGGDGRGRPYRLLLGCYPVPRGWAAATEDEEREERS